MEDLVEYHDFIDLTVKLLNKYSILQNIQISFVENSSISFSEAIVMSQIVKDRDHNMTSLASKLGVTKAAITKTIKKLENRELLQRYRKVSNRKEIFVMLTKKGEAVFLDYKNFMYDHLLKKLFHFADQYDKGLLDMMMVFMRSVEKSLDEICEEISENTN